VTSKQRLPLRRLRAALGLGCLVAFVAAGACRSKDGELMSPSGRISRKGGEVALPAMVRPQPAKGDATPAVELLGRELSRNLAALQGAGSERPAYFLAYDLVARDQLWLEAEGGAIVRSRLDHDRTVDVDVRVGSRELDNGHTQGGNYGPGNGLGSGQPVSIEDEPLALAQALWVVTEANYRDALSALSNAENVEQLRSQESERPESPDFSEEAPWVHVEPEARLDLAALASEWEPRLREASTILGDDPRVHAQSVVFLVTVDNRAFVNSEGTKVQSSMTRLRIMLSADGAGGRRHAADRFENFEVHTPEQLPAQALLMATARRLREELIALRQAPLAEPYAGPRCWRGARRGCSFMRSSGTDSRGTGKRMTSRGRPSRA
jgi:TldD protein